METNGIVILNDEHPDFKRLYWNTDKENIKHILSADGDNLIKYFYVDRKDLEKALNLK